MNKKQLEKLISVYEEDISVMKFQKDSFKEDLNIDNNTKALIANNLDVRIETLEKVIKNLKAFLEKEK